MNDDILDKSKLTDVFTGKSNNYSLFRPTYHSSLISLIKKNIVSNSVIVDIGCGTGILTKQLLDNNIKTIGIEPNKEMYDKAKDYLKDYDCRLLNTYAEDTTLNDNSIDLITVATALHWFDLERFIKESKRILKPNGKIAIIYNNMDKGNKIVDDYLDIHRTLCPKYRGGFDKLEPTYEKLFSNDYEINEYKFEHSFDYNQFMGYVMSLSYSLKEDDDNYNEYILRLNNFYNKYSIDGKISFPMTTRVALGSLK